MNDRQKTVFAAFFLALILAVPLLTLAWPRNEYSALEKRVLSPAPRFSAQSGQWSGEAESYLSDRLPLREALIGADAGRRLFLGLQINNAVYLENGALNERPLERDDQKLSRNLERLRAFGEKLGKRVTLVTPPSAGAVRAAKAGRALLPYPDREILSSLENSDAVDTVPLYDAMIEESGELFYRTDPHWNASGAYLAYTRLCEKTGFSPLPQSAFAIEKSEGFYGTCYSRAALWGFAPDTLELWDAGQSLAVSLDGGEKADSLFFKAHLTSADQYPVFLDGNHGLTVIENASCPNGKRLLMLKDSFGNSLVPLLAPHYSEIVVIDLRAYRAPVSALQEDAPFDEILAVYSLDRLTNDDNLVWLK